MHGVVAVSLRHVMGVVGFVLVGWCWLRTSVMPAWRYPRGAAQYMPWINLAVSTQC